MNDNLSTSMEAYFPLAKLWGADEAGGPLLLVFFALLIGMIFWRRKGGLAFARGWLWRGLFTFFLMGFALALVLTQSFMVKILPVRLVLEEPSLTATTIKSGFLEGLFEAELKKSLAPEKKPFFECVVKLSKREAAFCRGDLSCLNMLPAFTQETFSAKVKELEASAPKGLSEEEEALDAAAREACRGFEAGLAGQSFEKGAQPPQDTIPSWLKP